MSTPANRPPFVFDLHAHYPMQFDPEGPRRTIMRRAIHHEGIADRLFNRADPTAPHAVTIDSMVKGRVGAALSALYCPFEEMDVEQHYAAPPLDAYFTKLHDLLKVVEGHVAADHRAVIATDYAGLTTAIHDGRLAIIHAVEGGVMLGRDDAVIDRNIATLADRGCAYVTVCHLFWRQVGTNAPALPFLPDAWYQRLFPQPTLGLQPRGIALIESLLRHGVLIDITHMSEPSMDDTFALVDRLDPQRTVPIIASHVACRIGALKYNLTEPYVRKIAARGGVAGVIYCDHFLRDGGHRPRFGDKREALGKLKVQIDQLLHWGGEDLVAIGSDLDGFIKPTLYGLESAADHADVAEWLVTTYGLPLATKICHGNAMRVMRERWRRPYP